jgi:hypothetical protein
MCMQQFVTFIQNPYVYLVLIVWETVWKSITLWKSARKGQKYWFICLFIFNTLGLLPIAYLLIEKYLAKKQQKTV